MAMYVVHIGNIKNACKVLVRKSERKRSLRRLRCKEKKIIFRWILNICYEDVDWTNMVYYRVKLRAVVNSVIIIWVT